MEDALPQGRMPGHRDPDASDAGECCCLPCGVGVSSLNATSALQGQRCRCASEYNREGSTEGSWQCVCLLNEESCLLDFRTYRVTLTGCDPGPPDCIHLGPTGDQDLQSEWEQVPGGGGLMVTTGTKCTPCWSLCRLQA